MEGPIISATANAIDLMASPDKFQVDAHTLTPTGAELQTLPPRQCEISNPSQTLPYLSLEAVDEPKYGGQEFRGHAWPVLQIKKSLRGGKIEFGRVEEDRPWHRGLGRISSRWEKHNFLE